jgi:hypothetical protein
VRVLVCALLVVNVYAAAPEALARKIFPALAMLAESAEVRRVSIVKDPAAKWTEEQIVAAEGMNRIIDVYQLGQAPRYPAIDAPMYDVKSPVYLRMLETGKKVIAGQARPDDAFFSASLWYAILLLELNRRDEAVRFEPMEEGENRAAVQRTKALAGKQFAYAAIVAPGAGSDRPGVPLSPYGKLRLRVAAARYREGKAPFVIVSGGYVHPNQTPFNKALEMKKSLVEDFGVPAEVIGIDPHARHTTTNLRNAARAFSRLEAAVGV